MIYHTAADDCPSLAADPARWERLVDLWEQGEATVLVRHGWDCDPDVVEDCVNGNEVLTDFGREQASWVGEGFRRSLGGNFEVSHSYLHRTRETAMIAFGESHRDDAITKPCKDSFQDYVNGPSTGQNRIFVTHSSCINSMKDAEGERMLGFNAGKKAHFAIAAFLERNEQSDKQLLGCVWPGEWASTPDQRFDDYLDHYFDHYINYKGMVAQKVSNYFTEWL